MLRNDDPLPSGQGVIALTPPRFSGTEWPTSVDLDGSVLRAPLQADSQVPGIRRIVSKLFRYGATSAIALVISEIVLLVATAMGVSATLAAVIANLAGTVPSYLMSRYWIWTEAPRERVGRQVIQYWMTSIVSMTITSLTTGAIGAAAPSRGAIHFVAVGGGFLAINFVCWIAKYVVYQRFIFPERADR